MNRYSVGQEACPPDAKAKEETKDVRTTSVLTYPTCLYIEDICKP